MGVRAHDAALAGLVQATRRRLVIFSELPPHADGELPGWQLRLHRALIRRADGFVVVSSAARRRVEAIGAPPEPCR